MAFDEAANEPARNTIASNQIANSVNCYSNSYSYTNNTNNTNISSSGNNSNGHSYGSSSSVSSSMQECPMFCEGWLEKYSLGRSMFSSKGWHRRYFFLNAEGLGYAHRNPRNGKKTNAQESPSTLIRDDDPTKPAAEHQANLRYNLLPHKHPIKPSAAKCFIPFGRKLSDTTNGEKTTTSVGLLPVYLLENADVAQHPEVRAQCRNGVCCEKSSHSATSPEPGGDYYYYFGLSFEEKKKRFLLLLRTRNVQTYLKFKYYLRMYVHEASQYTLIPVAHPLEVNKAIPVDTNRNRILSCNGNRAADTKTSSVSTPSNLNQKPGFVLGGSAMQLNYYRDPDPCSLDEMRRIRKVFSAWDDGARERVLSTKTDELATLVRLLSLSLSACESEVQRLRAESPEQYTECTVLRRLADLSPDITEEEYEKESREATAQGADGPLSADGTQCMGMTSEGAISTINGFLASSGRSGFANRFKLSYHLNTSNSKGGTKNGKAALGEKAVVYSDASDSKVPAPPPQQGTVKLPSYTAIYANNNYYGGTNVVVAEGREALQEEGARNRILLTSSFATMRNANAIEEGSGLIASR